MIGALLLVLAGVVAASPTQQDMLHQERAQSGPTGLGV